MGWTNRARWKIVSAHGSETLAFKSAEKFMATEPKFRDPDKWEQNPLQLWRGDMPGALIRAWKNTKHRFAERDTRSLVVIELEVEGSLLDVLATI
jgi:hypothetical protein